MSGKKTGSGLSERMAAAATVSAVGAGFAAATGTELSTTPAKNEPRARAEVVALNIRLPVGMHEELRERAHKKRTSINAMLVEAASEWLSKS